MAIRQIQIAQGDDLHHIAQRETGDADRWWTIVIFNDLDYPYIDTDVIAADRDATGKKFLVIGDTLFIPDEIATDQTLDRQFIQPEEDYYEITFKKDVELDESGDLALNDARGDFRTVSGIENLVLALTHRLAIFRGELAYHPDYGSKVHNIPGQPGDLRVFALARIETVRVLRQDPRVDSVLQVIASHINDQLDIRATFSVAGERTSDAIDTNFRVNR